MTVQTVLADGALRVPATRTASRATVGPDRIARSATAGIMPAPGIQSPVTSGAGIAAAVEAPITGNGPGRERQRHRRFAPALNVRRRFAPSHGLPLREPEYHHRDGLPPQGVRQQQPEGLAAGERARRGIRAHHRPERGSSVWHEHREAQLVDLERAVVGLRDEQRRPVGGGHIAARERRERKTEGRNEPELHWPPRRLADPSDPLRGWGSFTAMAVTTMPVATAPTPAQTHHFL